MCICMHICAQNRVFACEISICKCIWHGKVGSYVYLCVDFTILVRTCVVQSCSIVRLICIGNANTCSWVYRDPFFFLVKKETKKHFPSENLIVSCINACQYQLVGGTPPNTPRGWWLQATIRGSTPKTPGYTYQH